MTGTMNEQPFVDCTEIRELEAHKFGVDASDLGWAPGYWPHSIRTNMGNGQVMFAQHTENLVPDLLWVDYYQELGCIRLRVYND